MRRIYVPFKWTSYAKAYRRGWADAAFGIVGGNADYTGPEKQAYEAGHGDFWAQNPQAGGGA